MILKDGGFWDLSFNICRSGNRLNKKGMQRTTCFERFLVSRSELSTQEKIAKLLKIEINE